MLQSYTLYTLVDITDSNVTNPNSDDITGYNQQQNLNTVYQLIGLRSQPIQPVISVLETPDVDGLRFGSGHKGLHPVWKMKFGSEHTDVFDKHANKVHFLENDFDGAAFISGLTETAKFKINLFNSFDKKLKNIVFIIE